jgi:hypothetical protein
MDIYALSQKVILLNSGKLKFLSWDIKNKKNTYFRNPKIIRPDGGTGRRAGLKHQWQQCCVGSSPTPGTEKPHNKLILWGSIFLLS